MILDLRDLKRRGKDQSDFYFESALSNGLVDIPNAQIESPVKITGSITLTGDHSAYIEGEIYFRLAGQCTRCLENAVRDYVIPFNQEVEENNDFGYSLVNDTVDLQKIVEDEITVNLPVNLLCKEDCKGLCCGCGANLNREQCKCKNK